MVADESQVSGPLCHSTLVAGAGGGHRWTETHELVAGARPVGRRAASGRFIAGFHRWMTEKDIQAWTAVRMIGEGGTPTNSTDPAKMQEFIKGPHFEVAAFKGQKLTLRGWDLQLRQPILLATPHGRVRLAGAWLPAPNSTLDTLAFDEPETKCRRERARMIGGEDA